MYYLFGLPQISLSATLKSVKIQIHHAHAFPRAFSEYPKKLLPHVFRHFHMSTGCLVNEMALEMRWLFALSTPAGLLRLWFIPERPEGPLL